jgi:hypothetical protein
MPIEADNCRKRAVPRLTGAGWEGEPHSIAEQAGVPDADWCDLLSRLALETPVLTRPSGRLFRDGQ